MKLHFSEAKDSASPGRLQPISLRETLLFEKWSRTLRVCLMADFYALLRFFKAKDSASPGWLQPTSLRETLLFEKWSRTLRVCLMADFYAYAPLAAAVGARASCAGRTYGRKSVCSSA